MKTPLFWQKRSLVGLSLMPVALLYQLIGWLRMRLGSARHAPLPIICVGNIVAGGAGKTPVALALNTLLQQHTPHTPHFISRGYGGKHHSSAQAVEPAMHRALDVGDEPLLLARLAPTWVCADRLNAAQTAAQAGASLAIMDDGLQHPHIHKDISLLVIDGTYGLGNRWLLPAGPLRESLASALRRVQAVVIVGQDHHHLCDQIPATMPVFMGRIEPTSPLVLESYSHRPVVAFAGIGRPEKFFSTLNEHGIHPVETLSFADHHPYGEADIACLQQCAQQHNALLLTTEKDHLRLPTTLRDTVKTVPVAFCFDDEPTITHWLREQLA